MLAEACEEAAERALRSAMPRDRAGGRSPAPGPRPRGRRVLQQARRVHGVPRSFPLASALPRDARSFRAASRRVRGDLGARALPPSPRRPVPVPARPRPRRGARSPPRRRAPALARRPRREAPRWLRSSSRTRARTAGSRGPGLPARSPAPRLRAASARGRATRRRGPPWELTPPPAASPESAIRVWPRRTASAGPRCVRGWPAGRRRWG